LKRADRDPTENTNLYPEVLRTFTKVIDGTPMAQTFEAVTSTFHSAPVTV
jgi:hypothetical protein